MLQFRGQMLAVEGEVTRLREELKLHDGALPTRHLDPKTIMPSRWANRHAASFETAKFASLKADIESAGGNIQAILVRPAGEGRFEVVFGHRRHRACLELGLPVLAAITSGPMVDVDLFAMMERENRERSDLSPYEQGTMYRRALDEHLYASQRRLAEALCVSHTWVNKTLVVADLPGVIVECFRNPLEIQHRHAELLTAALESDRKAVLRRAEKLRQTQSKPAASMVVETLLGKAKQGSDRQKPEALVANDRQVGTWSRGKDGGLTITIPAGVVADDRLIDALAAVGRALAGD